MTLDEAIKHAEEVADSHDRIKQIKAVTLEECRCAEEHRQLAEWLKQLKVYKEQDGDAISKQAVNTLVDELARAISDERCCVSRGRSTATIMQDILELPSLTPQPKMGRWVPLEYDGYADGNPVWDKWECSRCGWEHSGDEESLTAFCPNCGAKMEREDGEQ